MESLFSCKGASASAASAASAMAATASASATALVLVQPWSSLLEGGEQPDPVGPDLAKFATLAKILKRLATFKIFL